MKINPEIMKIFTSIGRMKFGEAENGHEFELKTIAEKSTIKEIQGI